MRYFVIYSEWQKCSVWHLEDWSLHLLSCDPLQISSAEESTIKSAKDLSVASDITASEGYLPAISVFIEDLFPQTQLLFTKQVFSVLLHLNDDLVEMLLVLIANSPS